MRSVAWILAAVGSIGCFQHVQLPPLPDVSSPRAERATVLHALLPMPAEGVQLQDLKDGRVQPLPGMRLNNGLHVTFPMDLLPAVHPESQTAVSAIASNDHRRSGNISIGVTVSFVGIALGLASGAIAERVSPGSQGLSATGNRLLISSLAMIGASIIPMVAALVFDGLARTEAQKAFESYPRDLRARLGLEEEPGARRGDSLPFQGA